MLLFRVECKLTNDNYPFLLALKAIAIPKSLVLLLKSPLSDKSRTLKLLQSPKALQNYLERHVFKLKMLLSLSISTLEFILNILYSETTASLISLLFPRPKGIFM